MFTKPDKSVQFARENTILVIDDENQLVANGKVMPNQHFMAREEGVWMGSVSTEFKKPILKNGPNSKVEKTPSDVQRISVMNEHID